MEIAEQLILLTLKKQKRPITAHQIHVRSMINPHTVKDRLILLKQKKLIKETNEGTKTLYEAP